MKLAIIRREYADYIDGVNRFIFTLADALASKKHEVIVMSHSRRSYSYDPNEQWDMRYRVRVEALEVNDRQPPWIQIAIDWLTTGSKMLSESGTDAVIVNGIVPLKISTPKVAVFHGRAPEILKEGARSLPYLWAARALYKRMNSIVCVSNKAMEDAERLGIKCQAMVPLPIFCDRYEVPPRSKRDNTVLHVGTRSVKNPLVSVETVERLVRSGIDIQLIMVGPMTDAVREIETKYRSAGWLDIRRNVSAKQLSSLYSRSLALLLPSQYEAMPYAVLEAQAAGTPVIVSNTVSEELVADRITGFRVSVHDPRVYGEKLRMLVEGETWGGMSMCARKHAEEFDAVKIAGRYIELISRFRDPTLPQELR